MKKLLIIFAVLFICAAAVSCSRVDDEIGYTLLTPVVDLGETLDGGDFIMTSAFTDKKYTATVDGSADTKTAGRHTVSVTVRGENGYERTHTCSYTVRSYVRDSVRLEAGTPITMDKFINKSMEGYARNTFSFVDDRRELFYRHAQSRHIRQRRYRVFVAHNRGHDAAVGVSCHGPHRQREQ